MCQRPRSKRFSLRAPSLSRVPNPFSPCSGLLEHGSYLSAAAAEDADTEVLDWLDEYGSMVSAEPEAAGALSGGDETEGPFLSPTPTPPDSPPGL